MTEREEFPPDTPGLLCRCSVCGREGSEER